MTFIDQNVSLEKCPALVLNANKDINTIRNLTIDGTFSDGNYTFDTDGNVKTDHIPFFYLPRGG